MEIAPGIHRIGDRSIVNAVLLEDAGEVTIIDAGLPGFYRDIPRELAAMGRTVADVRALVLTHGHTDHIGFAERLRRDAGGSRFRSYELRRRPRSRRGAEPGQGIRPDPARPVLGFLWFTILRGGLRTPKLKEVATFGVGRPWRRPGVRGSSSPPATRPGAPRSTPFPARSLFVGDAFATYVVTDRARDPRSRRSPRMQPGGGGRWPASNRSRRTLCCPGTAIRGRVASRRRFDRSAKAPRPATNPPRRSAGGAGGGAGPDRGGRRRSGPRCARP